jgi:hypothetical protein
MVLVPAQRVPVLEYGAERKIRGIGIRTGVKSELERPQTLDPGSHGRHDPQQMLPFDDGGWGTEILP